MRKLYGLVAVVIVVVILVVGFSGSTTPVEAQGNREIEVKRVNMITGQGTAQTLGVVAGISCLELKAGGVECFVVSTR